MPAGLCSLEELKRHLSIEADEHDSLLTDMIEGASSAIEAYCRTTFSPRQRTEYIDGTGANEILLAHAPVIEITDLRDAPDHRFESADPIDGENIILHEEMGAVRLISGVFRRGVRNVRAQYSSGYASAPADVRSACVRLAASWFNRARLGGDGLTGESLGDYSVRYEPRDLPADILMALRPYLQPNL